MSGFSASAAAYDSDAFENSFRFAYSCASVTYAETRSGLRRVASSRHGSASAHWPASARHAPSAPCACA